MQLVGLGNTRINDFGHNQVINVPTTSNPPWISVPWLAVAMCWWVPNPIYINIVSAPVAWYSQAQSVPYKISRGATFSFSLIGSPKYKGHVTLRCMWVLFGSFPVFPNFNRLGLHNKIHVALPMEILQDPHWKSDLPLFSYGYHRCIFVDFLIGYMDPLDYVQYWV